MLLKESNLSVFKTLLKSFLSLVFLLSVNSVNGSIDSNNVLFYDSFNKELTPDFANGCSRPLVQKDVRFSENGRKGKCLLIEKSSDLPASFLWTGNIDLGHGTLAFWHKAEGDSNQLLSDGYMFMYLRYGYGYSEGAQFSLKIKKNVFTLGNAYIDGDYTQKDSALTQTSQLGDGLWHHYAMTWDSNSTRHNYKFFIDGRFIVSHSIPPIEPWGPDYAISLGGCPEVAGQGVKGLYDDWIIFKRPLAEEEIKELCAENSNQLFSSLKNKTNTNSDLKISLGSVDHSDYIYSAGEIVRSNYQIMPLLNDIKEIEVIAQLKDYYGIVITEKKQILQCKSENTPLSGTFDFNTTKSGIFKIRLLCRVGGVEKSSRDIVTFTVLPKESLSDNSNSNSVMGIHSYMANLDQCHKLGARWFRLHGLGNHYTYWDYIQPDSNTWKWYDAQVNEIHSKGYNILGLLGFGARWSSQVPASEPPPVNGSDEYRIGRYMPKDINQWKEYVRRTVGHYKDRIKHWEIWNEPDVSTFWMGTPEQYVELLKTAYSAAKEADPNCTVIGGGGACSPKWIKAILEAGALNCMDAFSIHGYYGDATTSIDAGTYKPRIDSLRNLIGQYGRVVPIWNTEGGTSNSTFFDDLDFAFVPPATARDLFKYQKACNEIVKRWANIFSANVVRDFYYYAGWGAGNPDNTYEVYESVNSFNEFNNAPRPHAVAYAIFGYMTDGAIALDDLKLTNSSVVCHVFERGDKLILVIWADRPINNPLILKSNLTANDVKIYDIMGNNTVKNFKEEKLELPLFEEPYYLAAPRKTAPQILKQLSLSEIVKQQD